jgi:hypothetical protein
MIVKNNEGAINSLEYAELFEVTADKTVNRWGFFARQEDGTYAIYKPQVSSFKIGTYGFENEFDMEPGAIIDGVEESEIRDFIDGLDTIYKKSLRQCNKNTAKGWYYDADTAPFGI